MAATALQQQALALDTTFIARAKFNMLNVCGQVFAESTGTTGHAARVTYARLVQGSPVFYAPLLAAWRVRRPNLLSANTTVAVDTGVPIVSTDATDAAIQSQLMSDWSALAGA